MTAPIVTRFAPSPTGRLHVGNIRTALLCFLLARQSPGGRFLLRLDDTDAARSTEAYAQAIRDDLAWLGLVPDGEVRQSDRTALYDAALDRLATAGRAYRCYESPEELDIKRKVQLGRGLPPVYDRAGLALTEADHARFAAEGNRPHWRFRLSPDAPSAWDDLIRGPCHIDPASVSDPVIRRADGGWLYLLPSVVDDVDLRVTHVVRGEDHVTNTGIQLQMFDALRAPPPAFAHAALLTAADGPLSKRLGSTGADELRSAGIEPIALLAKLARLGTSDAVEAVTTIEPLIAGFDIRHLGRAAARFDLRELELVNQRVIHMLPYDAVADRLPTGMGAAAWEAVRGNLRTVAEAADWWAVIEGPVARPADPADRAVLEAAFEAAPTIDWTANPWPQLTEQVKTATGAKGRALFLPLRRALTGRDEGPDVGALLPLIGREQAVARLAAAVAAVDAG